MMSSLGTAFPKEQARVREVLAIYKAMGPVGDFSASQIEFTLRKADEIVISGDLVEMIQIYKEMQAIK